jgi:thioredoxin 1
MAIQIKKEGITLVDFGAPWCPPCKPLLLLLDELNQEFSPNIAIIKINVDESPEETAEYGIMSMPTVILFKNGQPVEKLVGLRPKEVYKNMITKHLNYHEV